MGAARKSVRVKSLAIPAGSRKKSITKPPMTGQSPNTSDTNAVPNMTPEPKPDMEPSTDPEPKPDVKPDQDTPAKPDQASEATPETDHGMK